jgi:hypothetical protein
LSMCHESSLVLSLIFVDRLIAAKKILISSYNFHRIVLTCLVLAVKSSEDTYYSNAFYAKLGGISTKELAILEIDLLTMIDYRLFVRPALYYEYFDKIRSHQIEVDRPLMTPYTAHLPAPNHTGGHVIRNNAVIVPNDVDFNRGLNQYIHQDVHSQVFSNQNQPLVNNTHFNQYSLGQPAYSYYAPCGAFTLQYQQPHPVPLPPQQYPPVHYSRSQYNDHPGYNPEPPTTSVSNWLGGPSHQVYTGHHTQNHITNLNNNQWIAESESSPSASHSRVFCDRLTSPHSLGNSNYESYHAPIDSSMCTPPTVQVPDPSSHLLDPSCPFSPSPSSITHNTDDFYSSRYDKIDRHDYYEPSSGGGAYIEKPRKELYGNYTSNSLDSGMSSLILFPRLDIEFADA